MKGSSFFRLVNLALTDDSWLQVHKDSSGNMFASSSLTEEGVEGVVSSSNGLVAGHLTVRLDAVLQAVQLPACIAHLGTGLADMHRNTLTLWREETKTGYLFFIKEANTIVRICTVGVMRLQFFTL